MTPLISFAITTHNEGEYIRDLFDQLVPHCEQTGDEIVVVDDNSTDPFTLNLLYDYADRNIIQLYSHELNHDFGAHKNFHLDYAFTDIGDASVALYSHREEIHELRVLWRLYEGNSPSMLKTHLHKDQKSQTFF